MKTSTPWLQFNSFMDCWCGSWGSWNNHLWVCGRAVDDLWHLPKNVGEIRLHFSDKKIQDSWKIKFSVGRKGEGAELYWRPMEPVSYAPPESTPPKGSTFYSLSNHLRDTFKAKSFTVYVQLEWR